MTEYALKGPPASREGGGGGNINQIEMSVKENGYKSLKKRIRKKKEKKSLRQKKNKYARGRDSRGKKKKIMGQHPLKTVKKGGYQKKKSS